jgi:perosamine synthetase
MEPVKIPVAGPSLGKREVEYVTDCIRSGLISSIGPYVTRFEKGFSAYCGCKFGIATNSGTTALHLAFATLQLQPGDEVIMPTLTMIACPNAVSYCGAKPRLVDAERETWNMDVEAAKSTLTRRAKGILAVHTYGHPVSLDPLMEFARTRGLWVLEDCAEAHGAEYRGRRVGSFGEMACYSFYANKIISTGEGGMIVTNNEELAERARWLRGHAFGRGGKHFWHEEIGFGYRMSALQAAVGLAQLENIDKYVDARRRHAYLYNSLLAGLKGLTLPPEAPYAKNVYWMYSILIDKDFGMTRDELISRLARDGVETRTFFYPVHQQPPYRTAYAGEAFPVADELSMRGMNLPSGNNLNEEDIRFVVDRVRSYVG